MPPRERIRRPVTLALLQRKLDALTASIGAGYLETDPIRFPHRYADPADRELVALLASALAYGQVSQVLASVERVLALLGDRPAEAVRSLDVPRALRRFRAFRHRFHDGRDVVALLDAVRRAWDRHGTLGDLFASGFHEDERDVGGALARFSSAMLAFVDRRLYGGGELPIPIRFLFPSPPASACKRMCLYLRWMIRPADGLDFGQWTRVPPRALVIPLDTHVARISRYIGLTRRTSPGWPMALEITESLRRLDPSDPIRYDFAICHLGILDRCPRKRDLEKCRLCPLLEVCLL